MLKSACLVLAVLLPTPLVGKEPPVGQMSAAEIDARLGAIPLADFDSRITLADWCSANGQLESANRILRQVLDIEPGHVVALAKLNDVAAKLPLQFESPVYRAARNLLPPRFAKTETKRFVVLSDADANWTRTQIERIERAHHQFMRFANRLDLAPLPLEHKLVCVLFARQDDYLKFAGEQDNVKDAWIAGYYSPRHDWIVFYDIRSNSDVKKASAKLDRMERDFSSWALGAVGATNPHDEPEVGALHDAVCRYHQHFAVEKQKLADFTERAVIATTVHEAIHHLMFHTRVQLRTVEYPLWISEGMATAFETDSPNQAFGPDHDFKPRRNEFVRLVREDKLLPLQELVTLTAMPNADPDTISAVYHGSYALVTWMCRHRQSELRKYFNTMQREPTGRSTRERHLVIFESIFGEVERVERAWMRHELNRPELSATLQWHRRLTAGNELVLLAEPLGLEQLRLAGLPIYNELLAPFAVATSAEVEAVASAGRLEPSADSATPGSVTISATPGSTGTSSN